MEKGFNTKRFLITLSFVLLTALTVGGATYYIMNKLNEEDKQDLQTQIDSLNRKDTNSSTTEASEWKTYTNNELGISFKYPTDFGEVKVSKFSDWAKEQDSDTSKLLTGDMIDISFSNKANYSISSSTPDFGYPAGIISNAVLDDNLNSSTGKKLIATNRVDNADETGPYVLKYLDFNYEESLSSIFQGMLNNSYGGPEKSVKKYYFMPINKNGYKVLNVINTVNTTENTSGVTTASFQTFLDETVKNYNDSVFEEFIKTFKAN